MSEQTKMRILVTGFTQRAVNSQRLRYDYLTSIYLLVKALKEMGHEVDHRRVEFNEDLSAYNLAIVCIGPPKSLTARHVHEACWTLQTARRSILTCDDWSIVAAGGNIASAIRCIPQWSEFMKFSPDETMTVATQLQFILDGRWPLLAPMFQWGDHSKLLKNNLDNLRLFAWDPTPYVNLPTWSFGDVKDRRWVYATLQDHEPWLATLSPQWPVERYGSYRAEDKYVSEGDLLKRYSKSWGVLCPEYKSAGSGWWRVRYQHAALLGCVLKCGITDGFSMGNEELGAYTYKLQDIEKMDDRCLTDLAEWQRDFFFEHVSTKQQTIKQLANWLEVGVSL